MQNVNNNSLQDQQASEMPHQMLRWFLILFLFLEYIRPPVLPQLKLQFIFIILVVLAFFTTRDRPWSGILFAMLLFFGVIAKSLPFALNNFSVYLVMGTMFGYIAVAFGMAWLMSWRASFKQVAWAWLLILAYCAFYAVLHNGRGPPGGYLGDENDMALAACVALPFALFGIDYLTGWKRLLSAGLALVFVAAVVASFSRGGFIGLAAVGLYYLISSGNRLRKIMIMGVIVSAFLTFVPQSYLDEMQTIEQDAKTEGEGDSTAKTRLFLWSAAINMWKANPVMGVGAGNFPAQVNHHLPMTGNWPKHYYERGWGGTDAHSAFFTLLAEHGTPGVLIYAYIIWVFIRCLRSVRREVRHSEGVPDDLKRDVEYYSAALTGGLVGFLFCGIFVGVLYYAHFWYLSGMAVALYAAYHREVTGLAPDHDEKNVSASGTVNAQQV